MTTYMGYAQSGAVAEFDYDLAPGHIGKDGLITDDAINDGVLNDMLKIARKAMPRTSCQHCARQYGIDEDFEPLVLIDTDSGEEIYNAGRVSVAVTAVSDVPSGQDISTDELRAELSRVSSERDSLSSRLSAARKDTERLTAVRDNQQSVLRQQDTRIVTLSSERDSLSSELSQLRDSLSGQMARQLSAERDKFQAEADKYRAEADSLSDFMTAALSHLRAGDTVSAMALLSAK
jgi:hypothetical protein